MKKTIALIISVILVIAIFASCAPPSEEAVVLDEEAEADAIDVGEDEALAELDTSSNSGLPIDSRDPRCCKNGCGEKLVKAKTDTKRPIRENQDCFKCPKCQTQYVRHWDGDNWQYCDVQINSKSPLCCKCHCKLNYGDKNYRYGYDFYTCSMSGCRQTYCRFWNGDFWDYHDNSWD